jgi:hypothetical protein
MLLTRLLPLYPSGCAFGQDDRPRQPTQRHQLRQQFGFAERELGAGGARLRGCPSSQQIEPTAGGSSE